MSRIVLAAFVLAACNPPKKEEAPKTAAPVATGDILVGQVGSVSGGQATFGRSSRDGVELALKKLNASGGIGGRKVKVIHYDDGGLPEQTTQGFTKLIEQDKVVAIIGTENSSNSIAAAPIAQKAGVVMLSPTATICGVLGPIMPFEPADGVAV